MKKIISSILIAIVILQIFAPFSVGLENKKVEITPNKSEAAQADTVVNISLTTKHTDTSITADIIATFPYNKNTIDINKAYVMLYSSEDYPVLLNNKIVSSKDNSKDPNSIKDESVKLTEIIPDEYKNLSDSQLKEKRLLDNKISYSGSVIFSDLESNTEYYITGFANQNDYGIWTALTSATPLGVYTYSYNSTTGTAYSGITDPIAAKVSTNPDGVTDTISDGEVARTNNQTDFLPICGITSGSKIMGCIAQGLYYLLFKPTSFIFGLTGKILDFSLFYSISDSSYRSTFVVEGWGIVRDFCNMFFIFVLLYVAIGTILNLHSIKTKEMIINVVIIGLLMNFSLFATQVIIDASNILTRVFYNTNTIATGTAQKDADGNIIKINSEVGEFGEIKLSEAIVSKVNPQKLISESSKISEIRIRGTQSGEDTTTAGGITTSAFILIVILTTAVNVIGIIAFLSCAIIFITRVIGLWLAMILVPLAFFSYTVPSLKGIKTIGWTHWWPDTLKLAFLAPVFAFFMYIIVGFMSKGLGVMSADGKTEMDFVVALVVPFVFIMILLMKAKSIANDMSGEIGQSITNGIKTVGGIALGAAAGGTALFGRQIIGKGMAAMSRSDSATHLATQKFAYNKEVEKWKKDGKKGDKPIYNAPKTGDVIVGKDGKETTYKKNPFTYFGGKLNEKQMKVGGIDHARHEEDEVMKASGLEGRDRATLSGQEIKTMEGKFKQMKGSDAEAAARKGMDAKGDKILLDGIEGGENAFKATKRREVAEEILDKAEDGDVIEETKKVTSKKFNPDTKLYEDVEEEVKTGKKVLSRQGEKKLEDKLNIALSVAVKDAAAKKLIKDFEHMRTDANKHVNPLTRGFAGSNKHSYDIRKLSEMKTDRREGILTKGTVGLVAAVAAGVRGGIKGVGMGNGGVKVEGDFLKDLGSTISDSLKSMKVNVNLSHVGEHKSSADAHGGGGHH